MDSDFLSRACKALGDPTRLRIYEFLKKCCCGVALDDTGDVRPVCGPNVGEVCCHITGLDKITSTISFHLKELREAEIITMEKSGKYMICGVNRESASKLAEYFAESTVTTIESRNPTRTQ